MGFGVWGFGFGCGLRAFDVGFRIWGLVLDTSMPRVLDLLLASECFFVPAFIGFFGVCNMGFGGWDYHKAKNRGWE